MTQNRIQARLKKRSGIRTCIMQKQTRYVAKQIRP